MADPRAAMIMETRSDSDSKLWKSESRYRSQTQNLYEKRVNSGRLLLPELLYPWWTLPNWVVRESNFARSNETDRRVKQMNKMLRRKRVTI